MELQKEKIRKALMSFIRQDKLNLLSVDIYEPTISHRIAVYLEKLFPKYNIDCEYNRNLIGEKKDSDGQKIRPDIIIHKRLSNSNVVIIEIKKNGKDSKLAQKDISKLKKCMKGTLNYELGVFVGVLKKKIEICWIEKDGNQILETPEILLN